MLLYVLLTMGLASAQAARCGWAGQVYLWDNQAQCDEMKDRFDNKDPQGFVDLFKSEFLAAGVVPRNLNPGFSFKNSIDWFVQLNIGIAETRYSCTGVVYSSNVGYSGALDSTRHYSLYIDFHFLSPKSGRAVVVNGEAQQVCERCNVAFTVQLPLVGKSVVSLYLMNFFPGVPFSNQLAIDAGIVGDFGSGPNVFVDPYVRDNTWALTNEQRDSFMTAKRRSMEGPAGFQTSGWVKATDFRSPDVFLQYTGHLHDFLGSDEHSPSLGLFNSMGVNYHQVEYGEPGVHLRNSYWTVDFLNDDNRPAVEALRRDNPIESDYWSFWNDHMHSGVYGGFQRFDDIDLRIDTARYVLEQDDDGLLIYPENVEILKDHMASPIFELSPSRVFTDADWGRWWDVNRPEDTVGQTGYWVDEFDVILEGEETRNDLSHFGSFNAGGDYGAQYQSGSYRPSSQYLEDNWSDLDLQWCKLNRWTTLFHPVSDRDWLVFEEPEIDIVSNTISVGISTGMNRLGFLDFLPTTSCLVDALDTQVDFVDNAVMAIGNPCSADVFQMSQYLPDVATRAYPLCFDVENNIIRSPLQLDLDRLSNEIGCVGTMNFRDAQVACENMPGPASWRLLQFSHLNDTNFECDSRCIDPFGLFWIGTVLSMPALGPLFTSEKGNLDINILDEDEETFMPIGPDGSKAIMDEPRYTVKFQYPSECNVFQLNIQWSNLNGPGNEIFSTLKTWRLITYYGFDVRITEIPNNDWSLSGINVDSVFSASARRPVLLRGRVQHRQLNFGSPSQNYPTYGINFGRDMLTVDHTPVVSFIGSVWSGSQCEFFTFSRSEALVEGKFFTRGSLVNSFVPVGPSVQCPAGYTCLTSGVVPMLPLFEFLYSSRLDYTDHFSLHWTCPVPAFDPPNSMFATIADGIPHVTENFNADTFLLAGIQTFYHPVVPSYRLNPLSVQAFPQTLAVLFSRFPGDVLLSSPPDGHVYCRVTQGPVTLVGNSGSNHMGWEDQGNGPVTHVGVALTLHRPGTFLSEITCYHSYSSPGDFDPSTASSSVVITHQVEHPGFARIVVGFTGIMQKWETNGHSIISSLAHPIDTSNDASNMHTNQFIFRMRHDFDFTLPSTAVEVRLDGYSSESYRRPVVVGAQVNWGNDVVGVWKNVDGDLSAYVSHIPDSSSGLEMVATSEGWVISAPDGFNVVITRSKDCNFIDLKIDVSLAVLEAACQPGNGNYCFGNSIDVDTPDVMGSTLFGFPSGTNSVHQPYTGGFIPRWPVNHQYVNPHTTFPVFPVEIAATQPDTGIVVSMSVQTMIGQQLTNICAIGSQLASIINRGDSLCQQDAYRNEAFCVLHSSFRSQLDEVCEDYFWQNAAFISSHPVGQHWSGYHKTVVYYFYQFMFESGVFSVDWQEGMFKNAKDAVAAQDAAATQALFCGDKADFVNSECVCKSGTDINCFSSHCELDTSELISSGLERSAIINSVTGEAWKMYKYSLYYFSVAANWVAVPQSGNWPVVLDEYSCHNVLCSGGTRLFGRTASGTVVTSTDKGFSWTIGDPELDEKEQSFLAHHYYTLPITTIDGLASDVWWLTENHLCVLSNRLTSQSKPLEYCVSWWCDCLDEDDWNAPL